MPFEPIVVFFIVRYLRKTVRTFSPDAGLDKILTIALYITAALFIAGIVLSVSEKTVWFWRILLLFLLVLVFTKHEFKPARAVMYAVLPLILISLVSDITETFAKQLYKKTDKYFVYAYLVAVTYMIAMLSISGKQQKALLNERTKRLEEEERSNFIESQKIELETQVAKRTAQLRHQKEELQQAFTELKATQAQLMQSEKMASLGELTAGIAHEIQNPLNFVNNFSEVNAELIAEMKEEINKGNIDEVKAIADDIKENEQKISFHGKRADSIVKGMLQHSRAGTGKKELTDINALTDEYLRLSYHGLRAKDKSFNATMLTDFDESIGKINIVPQDIGRVLLNLYNNAFYALAEKKKAAVLKGEKYEPTVWVTSRRINALPAGGTEALEIIVKDNGNGIPQDVADKIFQPFFTTKPTGKGTGLGLSISYDIITKAHEGEIKVGTKEGEYTEFTIILPEK